MFERFTKEARAVVIGAQQEAVRLGHPVIGTEHLLLAMLDDGIGTAPVLRDAGVAKDRVEADIARLVDTVPDDARPGDGESEAAAGPDTLDEADAAALRAIGIDIDAVRAKIEESFGPGAMSVPLVPGEASEGGWLTSRRRRRGRHRRFSPRAKKVLELGLREAIRLKHGWIGPEHLLLGLLREGRGLAAAVLTRQGVDLDDLRRRTRAALDRAA
jgi:ATP-dependent Clp protease ATP-binding subunit ClpA